MIKCYHLCWMEMGTPMSKILYNVVQKLKLNKILILNKKMFKFFMILFEPTNTSSLQKVSGYAVSFLCVLRFCDEYVQKNFSNNV